MLLTRVPHVFTELTSRLSYPSYRENDIEQLEQLPLPRPLPFQIATKKEAPFLLLYMPKPNANSTSVSYFEEQCLGVLCGMLYALPQDMRCLLYVDILDVDTHDTDARIQLAGDMPDEQDIPPLHFAHSITWKEQHAPIYTDMLLPELPSIAVESPALHCLSSIVQRYWESHSIQALYLSPSTEPSPNSTYPNNTTEATQGSPTPAHSSEMHNPETCSSGARNPVMHSSEMHNPETCSSGACNPVMHSSEMRTLTMCSGASASAIPTKNSLYEDLLHIMHILTQLPRPHSIPSEDLALLSRIKQHFHFSKTQYNKLLTLCRGHIASHGTLPKSLHNFYQNERRTAPPERQRQQFREQKHKQICKILLDTLQE